MEHWATRGTPSGWHFAAKLAVAVAVAEAAAGVKKLKVAEATEEPVVVAIEQPVVVAAEQNAVVGSDAADAVAVTDAAAAGVAEGLRQNGCSYLELQCCAHSLSVPLSDTLSRTYD